MSTNEPSAIQEVVQRIRQLLRLRRAEIGALLKETGTAWIDDNAPRLGASLAFYTLLSLAPIVIVVVAVAALAFGQKAAQGKLIWEIQDLVGTEGARAIQGLIQSASKPAAGTTATVLGVLTLVLGASAVVVELRDALNTIWHVPPATFSSLRSFLRLAKERLYCGPGLPVWLTAARSRIRIAPGRICDFVSGDHIPVRSHLQILAGCSIEME